MLKTIFRVLLMTLMLVLYNIPSFNFSFSIGINDKPCSYELINPANDKHEQVLLTFADTSKYYGNRYEVDGTLEISHLLDKSCINFDDSTKAEIAYMYYYPSVQDSVSSLYLLRYKSQIN